MYRQFYSAIKSILKIDQFQVVEGIRVLSMEEKARLAAAGFSQDFIANIEKSLREPDTDADGNTLSAAALSATLKMVSQKYTEATARLEDLQAEKVKDTEAIEALRKEKEEIAAKIKTLSEIPEPDHAAGTPAGAAAQAAHGGDPADDRQLCGMQGVEFALDRPYNRRARAALLLARGIEVAVPMASTIDYNTLREDLGAFYRRPWSERVQSFLRALPSITENFPEESDHQDLDTLVNIWLGEFSQADTSGESQFDKVAKGKFDFGTETLRMYGVMFVHRFTNLKQIEKLWIGSLNKEGSQAIKWSFVEYLMSQVSIALHNERERRMVNGVRKNPVADKPGRAMDAADGLYEYIRKRIEGHTDFTPDGGTTGKTVYQIKPFRLDAITPGNIGEVIYQGTSMIPSQWRDSGNLVLYIPSYMMPWYHKYNEAHYGRNQDYNGKINYVKEFPAVKIREVANADGHTRLIWSFEGNIKTYTQVRGEMFRFNFEPQDWSLKVWSLWKESIQAEAVGRKVTDPAKLDYANQAIWCTAIDMADDHYVDAPTGENPDVSAHGSVAIPEQELYEITDIKGATVGKAIHIMAKAADSVKIKKDGKFALLTADWTPGQGDVISLMADSQGNFIEIGRRKQVENSFRFPADDTTPDLLGAEVFVAGANTKATEITDFKNAETGTVYTIHGYGETNASVIKNGGKFALTADITLKDGAFIKLVATDGGKFYEIERG